MEPSQTLVATIDRFRPFLLADDEVRSEAMSRADSETLRELVSATMPLFDEINALLDVLVSSPHPLPEAQESLEEQLNSLGQAGMEARFELESRGQ